MSLCLLDLPQELVVRILCETDPISLARCTSTSKVLHRTIYSSSQLACAIETYLDGSEEVTTARDHHELLRIITVQRNAWRSLNWTLSHRIAMSQWCIAYELVGGIFAQTGGQNLSIVTLPNRYKSLASTHKLQIPFTVKDFAMDPTQDVIALLEYDDAMVVGNNPRVIRIHMRTLSTNVEHPHSRQSQLEFTVFSDQLQGNGISNALMQVVYDSVAIFFTQHMTEARVLLWNWRSGILLYDSGSQLGSPLPFGTSDFSLLDQTSFLVTTTEGPGFIVLFTFHPSVHNLHPRRVATFELPSLNSMSSLVSLSTHAGPVEANPLPESNLKKRDRCRIHVFTMFYSTSLLLGGNSTSYSYGVYVHQNLFTSYTEGLSLSSVEEKIIEWDDWGPLNTRLLPNRSPSHWLRYTHGQRALYSQTGSHVVEILDFSLGACYGCNEQESLIEDGASDGHEEMKCSSTLLPPSVLAASTSIFEADIITFLPCRVTCRASSSTHYAYMIYEHGIVGIQMEYVANEGGNLQLYVYVV